MELVITVLIAVLFDLYFGEPKNWHPLIVFGRFASFVEHHSLNTKYSNFLQKLCGIFALILILIIFIVPLYYLQQIFWLNLLLAPVILYFCIAANSLKAHAMAVYDALEQHDLKLARKKVAMIVSRDCTNIEPLAVRRATIESVLENGADAVFAPLFWFMIGGSIGVIFYRICNTLDAMWGYKNQRYFYFGWAAARLDDLLNYIPARLTALSYALLGNIRVAWRCWRTQAKLLDSPNAGVVMCSGAGSLNVKLGGAAVYHGKTKEKPYFGGDSVPENNDIYRANQLINLTLSLWVFLLIVVVLFIL
ncbi:MAG: cobalamin biosynthesis protein [Methylococcaceae bacterium]|nr:cobalamin biosynthesis protein [Methylococcaceae bacterium]